jgi:hypothetical protein
MLLLLSLVLAAPAEFEVRAPNPEERDRRAKIRCGGNPVSVETDAGVTTYSCEQKGVDLTDSLRECELVVRGKITNVETPPAKQFGDPAPEWKRATVKISSVLRGQGKGSVKFLFISSTKDGYEEYPKVKAGQEGLWVLTRGTGAVRELTVTSSFDSQPVSAEDYLKELIAETACPEKLVGTCEHARARCPGETMSCTCEPPCGGGAPPPPNYVPPLRWVCRPNPCASAKAGEKCSPDGMACEGCWGTHPFTCEQGRWKFHRISPPP